jgi:MFS family permease
MGLGTLAIGFIPTCASIGIWAPILLVSARLLQSFSVGGEFTTSITYLVEWAPPEARGFYGSLQQCGTNVGLLLGSGLAALASTLLDGAAMASWGWRVLFIVGGLTGFIGLYMRRNVDETPVFQEARLTSHVADEPRKKLIGLAFKAYFLTTLGTTAFFVFLFYMPTFTQRYAHLSATQALWSKQRWSSDAGGRNPDQRLSVGQDRTQAASDCRLCARAGVGLSAVLFARIGHRAADGVDGADIDWLHHVALHRAVPGHPG